MINLPKLATKHHWRYHPDGAIKIPFGEYSIEIYECDPKLNLVCIYIPKGTLWKRLMELGGKVHQEGDIEVVIKLSWAKLEEATELIHKAIKNV